MSIDRSSNGSASELSTQASELLVPRVCGTGPLELIVTRVEDLTPRIRRYELRDPTGKPLPAWTPGAHMAVSVHSRKEYERRCYSLMGDCDARDVYEIAVLRHEDGAGGSLSVHREYREGLRLKCAPPSNHFELVRSERPIVLIAGGIGITPIRSMAIALAKRDAPFTLHYAARSPAEMALRKDLSVRFEDQANFWFSDGTGSGRLDATAVLRTVPPDGTVYVCGPVTLIQSVIDAADGLDLPRSQIRFERFSGGTLPDRDRAFDVYLERTGVTIRVDANVSILEAVLAAGVPAKFGCRAGLCGNCAVEVLEGEVDHRDTALNDVDRTLFGLTSICVSRAKGVRLVLDL